MFTFKELVVIIGVSGISGFVSKYFSRHFREPTDDCLLQKKNDLQAMNGWFLTLTYFCHYVMLCKTDFAGQRMVQKQHLCWDSAGGTVHPSVVFLLPQSPQFLGRREIIHSTHKAGVRIKRSCT